MAISKFQSQCSLEDHLQSFSSYLVMRSLLLLLLVLLLFCCCDLCFVALSATVVTHLPGFNGTLPFYMETGYVKVDEENGAELFYYFIESEGDPHADPLLLSIAGGPRCSILSVLLYEIGPLQFVIAPYDDGTLPSLEYRNLSWTKMASIIFLDSPMGNGFSFSELPKGYDVGDVITSQQIYQFLLKWFIDHPQYLSNPFYLLGESYAGKIVPVVAQKVSEGIEAGEQPILNLKGYMVGNPFTGEKVDFASRVPFSHGVGILSDQIYQLARRNCEGEDYMRPRKQLCAEVFATVEKLRSEDYTGEILEKKCIDACAEQLFLTGGGNDLRLPPPRPQMDCRSYGWYLSYGWANNNTVREALGIKKGTVKEWIRCDKVLPYAMDLGSNIKYHYDLTTRGYRALVYSGDHDSEIPFLGTQRWVRSLNFSIVDDWRAWHLEGQSAGFTITYANNLTFATIKGGGHTAPEYRPEQCFAMAKRWLANEPL